MSKVLWLTKEEDTVLTAGPVGSLNTHGTYTDLIMS